MSTPNMGLVLPTDHGSADVWDTILDTIFSTIDSHDHTTGKGVKIPAAALNINADISWSSGGTSHSITDLVAVDFKPSPSSAVTALAGAFFVSDGTGGLTLNELYYRTVSGSNVKFTAGAALNVTPFSGGIGGDYASVAALEIFDDATDSYWFQQQVGSSVRQYARMRCSDVDLFEFKAAPTAGVPTNRVRLASPAALAASYALTMPAALPSSRALLSVDATGAVAAGALRTIQLPLFWSGSNPWSPGSIPDGHTVPISLNNGEKITAVRARIKDSAVGPTKLTVSLKSVADGVVSNVATSAQSAGSGANQTLAASGLASVIASGTNYQVVINKATGTDTVTAFWVEVDYTV